jgi:hypothetical protein
VIDYPAMAYRILAETTETAGQRASRPGPER